MSTRGNIAVALNSKDAKVIYNHYDSMYSRLGRMLKLYYNTTEKVEELINLGDVSSVGRFIGEKHDFNNCPDDVCNFYGRDRGEDNVEPYTAAIEHSWGGNGAEYDYLFFPVINVWFARRSDILDDWHVLKDAECGITEHDKEQAEKEIAEYNNKKEQHKDLDAMLDAFLAKF